MNEPVEIESLTAWERVLLGVDDVPDVELTVLSSIVKGLKVLDDETRARVLRYLNARWPA